MGANVKVTPLKKKRKKKSFSKAWSMIVALQIDCSLLFPFSSGCLCLFLALFQQPNDMPHPKASAFLNLDEERKIVADKKKKMWIKLLVCMLVFQSSGQKQKKERKIKRKENRNVLHNSVAKKISWSWQSVSFRFYSFFHRSFFRLFSSWLSAHLQHYSCHSGLYYWLVQPKGISKIQFASLTKSQIWHENVKIIAWKALTAVMVLLLLFLRHTIWHCLFIVYLFAFGRFGGMLGQWACCYLFTIDVCIRIKKERRVLVTRCYICWRRFQCMTHLLYIRRAHMLKIVAS